MRSRGIVPFKPRSGVTLEDRFWSGVDKCGSDECWPWKRAVTNTGYGAASAHELGRPVIGAHRLAWWLTYGPVSRAELVCHHCDNRVCCNPAHLFVGSYRDNMLDMWRKNRGKPKGSTAIDRSVRDEVRARIARGEKRRFIAQALGISSGIVSDIKGNDSWSWEL